MLDVREFAHRPGTLRRVALSVPAPADLGIVVVGVPEGADVELDLRLEAVVEGVLVSGTARAPLTGECARCLDPLDARVEADLQELYAFPGDEHGADSADDLDDVEERRLEDDLLDLEPALRDAVVLALPQAPLCRVDCPGLCSECGARLAEDPGHGHASDDPRWAALAALAGPNQPVSAGEPGRNEES